MSKISPFEHSEGLPLFDAEQVAEIENLPGSGSQNFLEELRDLYISTTPELLHKIHAAYRGQNVEQIKKIAHSLKSSSAHLGFKALKELCYYLEINADAVVSDSEASVFDDLEKLYELSIDLLAEYLDQKKAA